jgi:hypothetical protein
MQAIGWSLGVALVGLGTYAAGDIASMTSLIALSVLGAAVTLLALPETYRQELEAISHDEDEPVPAPAAVGADVRPG